MPRPRRRGGPREGRRLPDHRRPRQRRAHARRRRRLALHSAHHESGAADRHNPWYSAQNRRAAGPRAVCIGFTRFYEALADDGVASLESVLTGDILPPIMALVQPDPAVLRKAQNGDERAFTLILRAYER